MNYKNLSEVYMEMSWKGWKKRENVKKKRKWVLLQGKCLATWKKGRKKENSSEIKGSYDAVQKNVFVEVQEMS